MRAAKIRRDAAPDLELAELSADGWASKSAARLLDAQQLVYKAQRALHPPQLWQLRSHGTSSRVHGIALAERAAAWPRAALSAFKNKSTPDKRPAAPRNSCDLN